MSQVFEIGEVLGAKGNTKAKKLRQGGTLFVRVTPATNDMGKLELCLRGVKLKNVEGMFSRSDPFLEISSNIMSAGGMKWQTVYRSDHMPKNLDPEWKPFSVDIGRLCEGDFDKPIQIEVLDWEKSGTHRTMGKVETSVNRLLSAKITNAGGRVDVSKAFTLTKRGKDCGKIVVTQARCTQGAQPVNPSGGFGLAPLSEGNTEVSDELTLSERPVKISSSLLAPPVVANGGSTPSAPLAPMTQPLPPPSAPMAPPVSERRPKFVEYLTGGLELELSIASTSITIFHSWTPNSPLFVSTVDFTGSNGDPRQPGTLHYRDPNGQLNDYEKAITAVGGIIARYDSDQKFPVFGFGAKYNNVVQHCFQLGGRAEVDGIQGVLQAYRSTFHTGLTMSRPTVFAEVIDYTAATARSKFEMRQRVGSQCYKVLLIITDGAVSDIEATKKAIRAASNAPLSIVIVGVGNEDFSAMRVLDNLGGRDIVRFVEFSRHSNNRASLTSDTLAEIPDQLVDFFYSRGIKPLPAISGSQMSLNADEPTTEDVDLDVRISPTGQVSLNNYTGAMFDDTQYGTTTTFNTATPYFPSQASQQALMQQPSQSYGLNYSPTGTSQYNGFAQSSSSSPKLFHVQVPPNTPPGTQLRVTNPHTRQQLMVKVPAGVPPGGKFAVQSA